MLFQLHYSLSNYSRVKSVTHDACSWNRSASLSTPHSCKRDLSRLTLCSSRTMDAYVRLTTVFVLHTSESCMCVCVVGETNFFSDSILKIFFNKFV